MNRTDIPLLGAQLNGLAEVFGKATVSVKAMEVWFDALKGHPTEVVMGVLNGWASANGRFPTPAQVWERANEICIRNREEKAAFERAQNSSRDIRDYFAPTAHGIECAKRIRAMLGRAKPWTRERYIDHWTTMLQNPASSYWQKQMATDALKNLGAKAAQERVPGEDDELQEAA